MNKIIFNRRFFFPLILISFAFSLALFPDYLNIATVLAQHSEYKGPPPHSAIIHKICRKNSEKLCNEIDSSDKVKILLGGHPISYGKKDDTITNAEDKSLGIDGTPEKNIGGILGFQTKSKKKIKNFLAAYGFSKFYSEYFYPCKAQGSFTIGWKSQTGNNDCNTIQYTPDENKIKNIQIKSRSKAISKYKKNNVFSRTSVDSSIIDEQKIAKFAAAVHTRQYCSVIEDGGGKWNIQLSKLTYAPSNPRQNSNYQSGINNPAYQREATVNICNKALKACEGRDNKRTCSIVNHGKWVSTSQRPINLTLECAENQRYFRRGNGKEVPKLKDEIEKEARGAKSCTFNTYNDDDILISPGDDKRTLIHTNTTKDGFVINDLVGKVKITKLGNPTKPSPIITLKPRQRYEYRLPKARNLNDKERKEVYEEPVVQEFLQCDRWNKWGDDKWKQEICNELNQYREALKQFYQPPAVQVTEPTIDGVPIWLSTIDLSSPQTIVTLVTKNEVELTGGLTSFANRSNASLIANGTFKDEDTQSKNVWTMKDEGTFIQYVNNSERWSTGVTLGLKSGNEPEMNARAESQWDRYWFALTGNYWLVGKGTNNKLPKGSAARTAIGFSIKDRKLYHVITKRNVSLNKLSEIMQLVGCDEAVNLEGGGGRILAEKGTIKVPGEVRSPLIVVYDAANPAPENVRKKWASF